MRCSVARKQAQLRWPIPVAADLSCNADKYVLHRMLVFSTFAVFPAWGDVNLSTQASFCHAVAGGFGVEFESDTLRNGTSCDRPGLYVRRQI